MPPFGRGPPGFHSYQEAIRLYETEEAYQGLPFTDDVLATLNYHVSVSAAAAQLSVPPAAGSLYGIDSAVGLAVDPLQVLW